MLWWEGHPYILEFCGSLAMFHGRKASLPAAQECVKLRPSSHPVIMIYRTPLWFLSTPSHYDPSQCRRRWPSSEGEETAPPAADSRPTVPRAGLYFHLPLQIMSAIIQYFSLGLERWLSSEERALGAFEEYQGSIPTW